MTKDKHNDKIRLEAKISPPGGYRMNTYIEMQIKNITMMVKTFEQSCHMAATKDDGRTDKAEEKSLKKINAACHRFITELECIK